MATTLTQVEELIAERLLTLEPARYQQGSATDPVERWHEADVPIDPTFEPDSLAHLAFEVLTRSSVVPQADPGQQLRYVSQGEIRCSSQVDVMFSYRVRPTEQRADYRLAQQAAMDVLRVVNALGDSDPGDIVVRPTERFAPFWDQEGPWLLVRVGFQIDHNEEV